MKHIFTLATTLFLISSIYGQQSTKDAEIKVTVSKTIIQDGDTTIEEKVLEGDEAREFIERDRRMKEHHLKMKGRDGHSDREIEEAVFMERGRPPHGQMEKTIIHRSGDDKGTTKVIVRGDEKSEVKKKVIVRTISDEESDHEIDIELENGKLIIIRNGEKEVIELDDVSNKVIEAEGERKGKGVRKIIVIEHSEEIEETNNSESGTLIDEGPLKLDIMPNPNSGVFTVTYKLMDKGTASLTVTDTNGKKIYEDNLKGKGVQKKQIDIQQYGSGVYIINLNQNNEALSKRVIVE